MIPHSSPTLGDEEVKAVERVLRSGRIAQGREVEAFENECADFLGRRYAVAVSSGTAALHLAIGACEAKVGDPVVVPSYACAALTTAVQLQKARSVLCDIDDDYNLDPSLIPEDVRVVVLPHLFGAAASVPEGHLVIEDIAQSIGGGTGSATPVAITSFYATKLMTTGEGGMLFTDDEGIAAYARDRRDYDNRDDFIERYSYKMTDFQAAMGRVQLKRLPEFLEKRKAIALQYQEAFSELPLCLPNPDNHVFFRYVIATDKRDELEAHLQNDGVEAKRPVYRPAHHYVGGTFPKSEYAHNKCLSLPIYPEMIAQQTEHVIRSVESFFSKS